MKTVKHNVDLCVVGGGIAGLCAAVAAARHGAKVALMQDRPVLGGNASSEVRMWVCGADGDYMRETGIVEELFLENYYRNTNLSFSIWDSVLYEKARFEPNITLLLNCTCLEAKTEDDTIKSVTGWQLTTETRHNVQAKYFADCSGDSILAPLTGAMYMQGREGRDEFGESLAPEIGDKKTMGSSCLIQIREHSEPQEFIPPAWAHKYPSADSLPPHRRVDIEGRQNFWWIEVGGEDDTIHDAEKHRDELLKIAFGIWDHLKNHGDYNTENWSLDWVGFLPAKRESRRLIGDYIITQNDVDSAGKFDDVVAYGGWTMDDHHPAGFYYDGPPNTFHPAPSPWGICYRSLYSKNIKNLMFAGRNISVTHAAMSSSRVMATCGIIGQAVGTAAAIAVGDNVDIRNVDIKKLQQTLMYDDCYIPYVKRELSPLTLGAKTNAEVLRNATDRGLCPEETNKLVCDKGDDIIYEFDAYQKISEIRLVFDSHLSREYDNMPASYPLSQPWYKVPKTLVRAYRITLKTEGEDIVIDVENNYQRLNLHKVSALVNKIILTPLETWGEEKCAIFAMDVK